MRVWQLGRQVVLLAGARLLLRWQAGPLGCHQGGHENTQPLLLLAQLSDERERGHTELQALAAFADKGGVREECDAGGLLPWL